MRHHPGRDRRRPDRCPVDGPSEGGRQSRPGDRTHDGVVFVDEHDADAGSEVLRDQVGELRQCLLDRRSAGDHAEHTGLSADERIAPGPSARAADDEHDVLDRRIDPLHGGDLEQHHRTVGADETQVEWILLARERGRAGEALDRDRVIVGVHEVEDVPPEELIELPSDFMGEARTDGSQLPFSADDHDAPGGSRRGPARATLLEQRADELARTLRALPTSTGRWLVVEHVDLSDHAAVAR